MLLWQYCFERAKLTEIKNNQNVKQKSTFVIVYDVCTNTNACIYIHKAWLETVEISNILAGLNFFLGIFAQYTQPIKKVDCRFNSQFIQHSYFYLSIYCLPKFLVFPQHFKFSFDIKTKECAQVMLSLNTDTQAYIWVFN